MKQVGLQPSSSGMVGVKETGQRMGHYILPMAHLQWRSRGWQQAAGGSICNRRP
jgi:hypothetical protein